MHTSELVRLLDAEIPFKVPTVVYIKVKESDVPLGNSSRYGHPWALVDAEDEVFMTAFPRTTSKRFSGKPPKRLVSQKHEGTHNCQILTLDAWLVLDYQRPATKNMLLEQLRLKQQHENQLRTRSQSRQLICRQENRDFSEQIAICLRALGRRIW